MHCSWDIHDAAAMTNDAAGVTTGGSSKREGPRITAQSSSNSGYIHTSESTELRQTRAYMFVAALFTTDKEWKWQCVCPLMDQEINKM